MIYKHTQIYFKRSWGFDMKHEVVNEHEQVIASFVAQIFRPVMKVKHVSKGHVSAPKKSKWKAAMSKIKNSTQIVAYLPGRHFVDH